MIHHNQGQALFELILSSMVACLVIVLASSLLFRCWQRVQCAYLAFESAQQALIGETTFPYQVKVEFRGTAVHVSARCGREMERVELPFLEHARW